MPVRTRRSTLSRRVLIAGDGVLGCCVAVSAAGAASFLFANRSRSTVGDLAFATPLDIPPLLEGERDDDGRAVIDLALRTGRTRIVPAGALEVWNVRSNGQPHTFHIHGATFHVLEVEGEAPPAHLRGPKDTVFVGSGHAVRLLVRFGTHTDPKMPYMYHCLILRHEDNGMMGQFVVVEPGTEDNAPTTIDGHAHH